MKSYSEFWIATLVRGILAVIAATGVLVFPQMASTVLLLPFAIVISILCLAVYGTLDSAVLFASSFMITGHRAGRIALRSQGVIGAAVGVFLFALVYGHIDLHWFLYLAAFQAGSTAVTEFVVARGHVAHTIAGWCYVSAGVAAVSAVVLLLGRNSNSVEIAWVLYVYLGVFGFNLIALSARMLFAVHHTRLTPAIS